MASKTARSRSKSSRKSGISEQQHAAIRLLLMGSTQHSVAEQIDTTPETISRWLRNDADFIATLNYQRQSAYQSVVDRMRSLAHTAVGALETGLESENEMVRLKTAQTILKMISLDAIDAPQGPTNAQEVKESQDQQEIWRIFNNT